MAKKTEVQFAFSFEIPVQLNSTKQPVKYESKTEPVEEFSSEIYSLDKARSERSFVRSAKHYTEILNLVSHYK
jgi:hypothetical protein